MKAKRSGQRSLQPAGRSRVTWSEHVGIRDGCIECDRCRASEPLPCRYDEEAIDRTEEPDKFAVQAEERHSYLDAVQAFLTVHRKCLPNQTEAKPKKGKPRATRGKPKAAKTKAKPKAAKTTAKPKAAPATGTQKGLF
jgi:hypothetical protein